MIIDCAVYEAGVRTAGQLDLTEAFEAGRAQPDSFVWIGLHEPTPDEFKAVSAEFELHPLAVEDALHAQQRPKLETYGDSLFLVVKPVRYVDSEEVIETGQVVLFVGDTFVVSVRHGETSALHDVRLRLEAQPELLKCGPSAVVYAVLDRIVDDYGLVMREVDDDVDQIEAEVFSGSSGNRAPRIYKLKREVMEFRRAVVPLRDPVRELMTGRSKFVHPHTADYFRDVHDHITRVSEQLESVDTLLSDALSANLAEVGIRQNEDMRKISSWVAIAAVPTMIAGIYGMNFTNLPELEWKYGYFMVLGLMAAICGLLYRAFKRNGWL
ncbi:MAG TPA: magnesium/cobalt transporter CorA [Mycobacteriales bacterium]|nr:magnesium/cobalt transporter CorA [Mycobacteriales bacterium]